METQTNTVNISAEQANLLREECKKAINLATVLRRLEQTQDFKALVKNYTEEEPVRLVNLLGEPTFNMSDKKTSYREDIHEEMIGIARFTGYLRRVYQLADRATKTMEDLNSAEMSE